MTSGVRQGCPLSPLLYAIAADALLEKICDAIPDIIVRAYADDTAVVLTDFWKQAPILARIFEEFGMLSNLRLNHDKCIIIPLNPTGLHINRLGTDEVDSDMGPLQRLKRDLNNHLSICKNMLVEWSGTYLGFAMGPGRGEETWSKPTAKYMERCAIWSGRVHGFQHAAVAYNAFAMSTFSYVAQLETPPNWVYEGETNMLRRLAPGPKDWAVPSDLWHLKDAYAFPCSFTCLEWLVRASQLRVYLFDPATADNRRLRQLVAEIRNSINCPSMPYTKMHWKDWFERSFILQLENNYKEFMSTVCQVDEIINALAAPAVRPFPEKTLAKIKDNFSEQFMNVSVLAMGTIQSSGSEGNKSNGNSTSIRMLCSQPEGQRQPGKQAGRCTIYGCCHH
jgi:hypothetical protein